MPVKSAPAKRTAWHHLSQRPHVVSAIHHAPAFPGQLISAPGSSRSVGPAVWPQSCRTTGDRCINETPNLRLPYLAAAQAQKHVTHNEAIWALDAIVQLAVLDRGLAMPPRHGGRRRPPAFCSRPVCPVGPSSASQATTTATSRWRPTAARDARRSSSSIAATDCGASPCQPKRDMVLRHCTEPSAP
jgi:Protein of unknown function (DUF2793)